MVVTTRRDTFDKKRYRYKKGSVGHVTLSCKRPIVYFIKGKVAVLGVEQAKGTKFTCAEL